MRSTRTSGTRTSSTWPWAGAIGEGFGDYWAVSMSIPVSKNYDLPCVMDWDATSYTSGPKHCLRRTDTGKTTDDMTGEVHDDGEIWSNALWDIHQALGRNKANKVILQGTFFYAPDTRSRTPPGHRAVSPAALRQGCRRPGHPGLQGAQDPLITRDT
ncbi:fungalysin metallopeptidase (M36) [Kribbella sp. VKM Ac-2500]|uniref:M36 family metallopeptidase n=1 Tax=Kribbella sp. VKM Ac-2500 TaxID=2512214 RepID=UPI001047A8C5|nr:M36 family metallopeptidase [Kribbella sp. VKM Ac-2500]TCN34382.1 fungalysin metallopeptidase (M36) [Kribbella sp. VKM Ac-2500]